MIHSGYTKLFSSIVASTIWREDDKTRLVWITLLALSDRDGYVAASLPGLADLARVSIEDCEKAIEKLQQPDKYSRSPEHDGRRIQTAEGGWLILNRAKYRDLIPEDHRRERDRLRQQKHRQKQNGCDVTGVTRDVRDSHEVSPQTETETETENTLAQAALADLPETLPDKTKNAKPNPTNAQVDQLYQLYPRKRDKLKAQKAIRKAVVVVMAGDPDHTAMSLVDALDYLAQRVTLYAQRVRGCEPDFIPYPATWFNAGSFWDDEREWGRKPNGKANGHEAVPLPPDYVPASEQMRREQAQRAVVTR